MWEIVGVGDQGKLPIFSQTTVVPNTGNFTSNLHFSTGIRTPRPTPNFPEKVVTKCVQRKTFEFRISRANFSSYTGKLLLCGGTYPKKYTGCPSLPNKKCDVYFWQSMLRLFF